MARIVIPPILAWQEDIMPTIYINPYIHGGTGNGLLNALIAYWPGNEASGDLLDLHSNSLTLTDTNSVTNAAGKVYATARQYTAANFEYHARAGNALLSTGDVDFTFATWVYLDTVAANNAILGKYGALGQREYGILYPIASSRIQFRVSNDGTNTTFVNADALGTPSASTWYLVVAWHDSVADTINIQINNGTANSAAHATGVYDSAEGFTIGYASVFSSARIGPTAFWKSAAGGGGVLSADQRTALYNGGTGLAYAEFTT